MPLKSIIDIDVDDASFNRFQQAFQKYQDALSKTPKVWRDVGKEQSALVSGFERMSAEMATQARLARAQAVAHEGEAKHLTHTERLWTNIARSTKSIEGSVVGATTSLLRWSALALGAAGAVAGAAVGFGLWGFNKISGLAEGAANERRGSMGLGMSIGEREAFKINFGRVVDPDSFLGNVNEMLTNPSKSGPLWSLGIGTGGSLENTAIRLLQRERGLAQQTPIEQLGTLNAQYGLGLGTDEWRRIRNTPATEWNKMVSDDAQDTKNLNISDSTAGTWQRLVTQLDRAKDSIHKTFVDGLIPLEGPLEHLSGAFNRLLGTLMHSDLARKGILTLSHWLDDLGGIVGSQKFNDDIREFFSNRGTLGTYLHAFATGLTEDVPAILRALHVIANPLDSAGDFAAKLGKWLHPSAQDVDSDPGLFRSMMARQDVHWSLPTGLLETIQGLEGYSPHDSFQGMGEGLAKRYGVQDYGSAAERMQGTGKYLSHLEDVYKGDVTRVMAAYRIGEDKVNQLIADAKKNGGDWRSGLSRDTRQYLLNANPLLNGFGSNVHITVTVPPGANVNTSVNGLNYH